MSALAYPFIFAWANNPKRATLKGRRCRIIGTGTKCTAHIEFDNGQREVVSRRALRKGE